MSAMTLVCNEATFPVGLIPVRDAVSRLAVALMDNDLRTQAIIDDPTRMFRSRSGIEIAHPHVIIVPRQENEDDGIYAQDMSRFVELRNSEKAKVTRRVLFARDKYTCQYCGMQVAPGRALTDLTVDHVKPAHMFESRAAATMWENVVAACKPCNNRKGGMLPMQAGMMPACTPQMPHFVQLRFAGRVNQAQKAYLLDWFSLEGDDIVI